MTLFWHGHFACRVRQPGPALRLHNTTRRLALGKFPDLLLAVSQEPAMLQFLNNQQNRKAHPNENFAREVMELFTLGRGNYTEQDVKEAARAFTGWSYDNQGSFRFQGRDHDADAKTFLGHTGNLKGEDVLRIIFATARNGHVSGYQGLPLFCERGAQRPPHRTLGRGFSQERLRHCRLDGARFVGAVILRPGQCGHVHQVAGGAAGRHPPHAQRAG